jgi:LysR family glycine cleavage system transcriptional activator
MRQYPSLNLLRSLEVIGRHLNLARAAKELHLTPSALSHQLNTLEEQLGVKLFTRTGRGLLFTDLGHELHAEVDFCLNRLRDAMQKVSAVNDKDKLVVSSLPTFAQRWLLPRFAGFSSTCPSVEIRISTSPIAFERDGVDCAIFYGQGDWPETTSEYLREEHLILVCSPATISAERPLMKLGDLRHHQLLSATNRINDWKTWFESAGMNKPDHPRELVLQNRNLVIQAAISGLGVALVDPLMIQADLETGKLVQPVSHTAKGPGNYYLVYSSSALPSPKVKAFRDWLIGEMHSESMVAGDLAVPASPQPG